MTTKTFEKIKELNAKGLCDADIARELGIPYQHVRYWRMKVSADNGSVRLRPWAKRYMVYDGKTTQFFTEGTAAECAARMGIKRTSFHRIKVEFDRGNYHKYEIYEV